MAVTSGEWGYAPDTALFRPCSACTGRSWGSNPTIRTVCVWVEHLPEVRIGKYSPTVVYYCATCFLHQDWLLK